MSLEQDLLSIGILAWIGLAIYSKKKGQPISETIKQIKESMTGGEG
jgi:macrodomain Ter protein organizer (MatP/YcbG family)